MILLAFKKNSKCGKFGDKLIAFLTRSKYSHVAVIASGKFYEAHILNGTRVGIDTRLTDECWDSYSVRFKEDSKSDLINIINRLISEGNRKSEYNLIGAVLSLFRINIRREKKVFCSELIAYGFGLERPASFTPQRLIDELKRIERI